MDADIDRADTGRRASTASRVLGASVALVLGVLTLGVAFDVSVATDSSDFSWPSGLAIVLQAGYLAAVTPGLVRMDILHHRLPNVLVLPGYGVAAAAVGVLWAATGRMPWAMLAAGGGYLVFFFLAHLLGSMGMGDVKLAGLLGLCLGSLGDVTATGAEPLGLAPALIGVVLAFVLGGVAALVVVVRHPRGARASIPFGPFLLAGFWLAFAAAPAFG